MKKKWFLACIMLLCLLVFSPSVTAAESLGEGSQRIFDNAELFDADQSKQLQEMADRFREQHHMDLVVLTTDNSMSSYEAYADDFYDYHGFGIGENDDGILLLISVRNASKYAHISTTGAMIPIMTDARIERTLDDMTDGMKNEKYADAAKAFIRMAGNCAGVHTWGLDIQLLRLSWQTLLIAAVLAFLLGIGNCEIVKNSYQMVGKQVQESFDKYRTVVMKEKQDQFINEVATSRRIEPQSFSEPSPPATPSRSSYTPAPGPFFAGLRLQQALFQFSRIKVFIYTNCE